MGPSSKGIHRLTMVAGLAAAGSVLAGGGVLGEVDGCQVTSVDEQHREIASAQPGRTVRHLLAVDPSEAKRRLYREELFELATRPGERLRTKVKDALLRPVENPESVAVAIELGTTAQTMMGHIPRIDLDLRGARLGKLRIRSGRVLLEDVIIDYAWLLQRGRFRTRWRGREDFSLEIHEDDLNAMLSERGAGELSLAGARVSLGEGSITLRGRKRILGVESSIAIQGSLYVRLGAEIRLGIRSLKVGGLPVPRFLIPRLRRPLVDLSSLHLRGPIEHLRVSNSLIIIRSERDDGSEGG